jgi:alpha-2-macroglobulin
MLWEGVHDYSYVARATSIGEFVVPPASAEEMYSPELFGRSSSAKVIII